MREHVLKRACASEAQMTACSLRLRALSGRQNEWIPFRLRDSEVQKLQERQTRFDIRLDRQATPLLVSLVRMGRAKSVG